jgi:pyrroline-5-carboxylate reductase
MGGLTDYFEARQIGGGKMTKARIKDMITSACKTNVESLVERFEEKLQDLADTFDQATLANARPTRTDGTQGTTQQTHPP